MNEILKHKGYTGTIEVSVEDKCLHGEILFINDLITYEGESVDEIYAAFKNAVEDYLAYCDKTGKPANKPCSGTFNVRVGPELHKLAAQDAYRRGISINEFVCDAVRLAIGNDTPATVNHVHSHSITVNVKQGAAIGLSTMKDLVVQEASSAVH